jgi:Response regulators consisting of a CheY-like receiver domain and a winged-helix DNA-binding domain
MGKVKILMIDDETDVLSINKEFFKSQDFDVKTAATLAEARLRLDDAPDIILLDVMLPDGMGWDFAEEIRDITRAPIIYLTCRDENESVVKGLTRGGDDYIVKPYDMNVLYARIISVLRRVGFDFAGIIEVPPLKIDMLSGTADLTGKRINLAPREIQMLACLAQQAGRYVKSADIYRRVWGEPLPGYERTISVYATYLRQKLNLAENRLFEIRSTSEHEYILSKISY